MVQLFNHILSQLLIHTLLFFGRNSYSFLIKLTNYIYIYLEIHVSFLKQNFVINNNGIMKSLNFRNKINNMVNIFIFFVLRGVTL